MRSSAPTGDDAFDERIRSDRELIAQLQARNAASDQGKAVLNEAMTTIRRLLGPRRLRIRDADDA